MSIKPVDFQVMLPRTTEISKIHSDEQHKNQIIQQQQESTVQHKAEDNVKYVHSQDKVQEAKIREKEEKERNDKKQEKRKNKNKGNYNSNSKKEEDIKTSTIDIRL
ncbi:MAG: hypothetical protein N3I35_09380 [Clostridia bacterium]|nr:hypothetical protein [Clostridia bacterium]